jgi:beta-glucanase (GH16 family)
VFCEQIDWEFVGSDNVQVQTNYFSKGDTSTYDRGAYHPVSNPTGQFHTYTVEWTSQQVNWLIDGVSVRVLSAATVGAKFPQTPMQVKLGTWCAGGKNSPQGTREWAGGFTDFSKAPFNAYYKSVSITDYAGKDSPANGGIKEYIYGDQTGSWQSIKVVNGDGSSDSSSSSSAAPSSTKASSTSAKTSSVKPTSTKGSESSKTSEEAKTTMSTATSGPSNSTTSATTTDSQNSATSTPTTVPKNAGNAVPHGAAAALALVAGAGVAMAQLFL